MNGYHALKGFEYQTTVSLDMILDYFQKDTNILVRPEGKDDLVISFGDNKDYIQIKKPRENAVGEFTPRQWTISQFVKEILINSYDIIADTQDRQIVVLGDEVDSGIVFLTKNDSSFTPESNLTYIQMLHIMAREKARIKLEHQFKFSCRHVEENNSIDAAVFVMVDCFVELALKQGISEEHCCLYKSQISEIHKKLPSVLARTKILCTYGCEKGIRERIKNNLTRNYHLPEEIVKYSLIRNLRGFLNDIATQPDKWFSHEQFESEIRSIWPRMTFIGEPPSLEPKHLCRPTLVKRLIDTSAIGPTEVIGVSGSGKTLIAREIMEYVNSVDNDVEFLYVEAKYNADFRDVIAGIAYSLRNFEITRPFNIAVQPNYSNEKVFREIARELNGIAKPILILLDFVEGLCSDAFAKNLQDFLECFRSNFIHLIFLGQESIFRNLSILQRESLKIPAAIDMPGFDFEEFYELVSVHHDHNFDRTVLWGFFEQLTAGRSAGLFARLANNFASGTITDMERWVAFSPEQIIENADIKRYRYIPEILRITADKIICFALPFSAEEAETIFPQDHVLETIHEMHRFGLLRNHDEQLLEIHETTRLGLEKFIPATTRQIAHDALAKYYFEKGDILASILHLEKAGKIEQAMQIAKEQFLRGENWSSLSNYIAKNKLLNGTELIPLIASIPLHKNAYILPYLFNELGDEETAQELFELCKRQSERSIKEFQWAWLIIEAIIACDSKKIHNLLEFGIQKVKQNHPEVLENIIFGARRNKIIVDKPLVEMLERQTDDIKICLIPLFLRDKCRYSLQPVLEFLYNFIPADHGINRNVNEVLNELKLYDELEVIEFISAIPSIKDIKDIMLSKSVLLGNIGFYIWKQRHVLIPVCKKLLSDKNENDFVLENAIRILVFCGDSDVIKLTENFIGKKSRLSSSVLFMLTLIPKFIEIDLYKKRLFNTNLNFEERLLAFYILISVTIDVDEWFKQLLIIDHANSNMWEFLILINCVEHPVKCAVPILKDRLTKDNDESLVKINVPLIMKLSELPGEEIADFLIDLLSSPFPEVRTAACISLQFRRSSPALVPLLELLRQEKNEGVGQMAIIAAIVSGPQDFNAFANLWQHFKQATIWRCILAGRLQIMSEAPFLIKIAIDKKEHWQIRRAAILAAGWLRSKKVMEEIAHYVLSEKLAFAQDKSYSLLGHNILSILSLDFATDLRERYRTKKAWCYDFVADTFDSMKSSAMFSSGTPSGTEAAQWLFEQLEINNWPEFLSGADDVNNYLHIPILYAAVLRGLRLCDSFDIIEKTIAATDTEWVLMRALCEWTKGRAISKDELYRIGRIVETNPLGNSPYIKNIFKNIDSSSSHKKDKLYSQNRELKYQRVTSAEIKRALNDGQLKISLPLKIVDLDEAQYLELVQELSPVNDYKQCWIPKNPHLSFTEKGYSVNGVKPQSIERYAKIRANLRSALVAANYYNVQIPWHHNLLINNMHGKDYVKDLLIAFGSQNNSEKLYEELEVYGDIYLTQLTDYNTFKSVEKLFDQRIIPFLERWSYYGNDELLEALCRIASCISDCSIDEVLAGLFYRWCQLLKIKYKDLHAENIHLWRAFNCMKIHSRFTQIPNYDFRLAELLALNIPWYHKNDIIEIIALSSRMYCRIETLLMKSAPFEHFHLDEVDRLDDAGQRLFMLASK